ncbi:hypothetical protein F2Q70_00028033 [Brassica cretica]|uniref:CCHC-type domain-containing protein n=1 Tax=Brassica cretica TaxID=69181 RepID=A0A3N6SIJ3_BRACR|nr:hypothetical protein F2Q70_00028033 [Brassica cretica]KAF3579561.1 hypothetical protein DY000_02034658 [Brassica cretica]
MQTHKPRLDPTCLGEAKLLVGVELDKPFPKQIALDDKQGNIFLVDVEYTWIPSICGRCGQLGHKERRCLIPAGQETSHTEDLSNESPRKMETQAGVEQVLSTPPHFPAHSPIATTQKDSSTVSHSSLDAKSILVATLAGSSSAPTFHQIMDNVPSDIIISEGILRR